MAFNTLNTSIIDKISYILTVKETMFIKNKAVFSESIENVNIQKSTLWKEFYLTVI